MKIPCFRHRGGLKLKKRKLIIDFQSFMSKKERLKSFIGQQ